MDRYEASADPLFLTRAVLGDMEKEAMFKMSRDSEKWEEDIMGLLHEQYPFLQEYQTRIHMNKTDPDTGAGVGQIVLDDKIGIPVIIDAFKMHPLDLFYHEGKLRPMTKPTLLGALQETGVGTPVQPGQGEAMDMSLYTDTRPPSSGRYSMASSLMFTQDQLEHALSEMGEQGLAFALGMNPAFKKTASVFAANTKKEMEKKAEDPASYSIREVFTTPYEPILGPGAYVVITGGMTKTAGFVFDHVIDLNDRVVSDMKLFSGFDGKVALAENMGGVRIDGDFALEGDTGDLDKIAMHSDDLSPGIGFFWMAKKGHAVATLPVKVLYQGTDEDGQPFVKIADVSVEGQTRKVYASGDYSGLLVEGDTIFMGVEAVWRNRQGGGCPRGKRPGVATGSGVAPSQIRPVPPGRMGRDPQPLQGGVSFQPTLSGSRIHPRGGQGILSDEESRGRRVGLLQRGEEGRRYERIVPPGTPGRSRTRQLG